MKLDVYHHFTETDGVSVMLARIYSKLQEVLMANARLDAALARIDKATTDIATDLRGLRDQVKQNMTAGDVDAISDALELKAKKLEEIGSQDDANAQDIKTAGDIPPR